MPPERSDRPDRAARRPLARPDLDDGFVEVADRCWVSRSTFLEVNVGLVAGERGLVLVDCDTSTVAARRVLEAVRHVSALPLLAVVDTHHHFDHTFGHDAVLAAHPEVDLLCHEEAAAALEEHAARIHDEVRSEPGVPEHAEIAATTVVVPSHTFSSAAVLDLGDRVVELAHPGRGHTAGDVVALVPDAGVVFAGDLVEEAARTPGVGPVPGLGDDSFPLEWPATLDLLLEMTAPGAVVVPGHGLPVERDFVLEQRSALGTVAETIRDLAGRGVPVAEALGAAEWPYPREELRDAVRRGYAHLPRSGVRLPLV